MSKIFLCAVVIQVGMACAASGQTRPEQPLDTWPDLATVEILPLSGVDATVVSSILEDLVTDDDMRIEVGPDSITVRGSDATHRQAKSVINALRRADQHQADQRVEIFALGSADVRDTVALLQKFFAEQNALFEGDPSANTVIVRASPSTLDKVRVLLQELDSSRKSLEPASDEADGLSWDTASADEIAELERQYLALDRKAKEVAGQIHKLSSKGPDDLEVQRLKETLREVVERAFATRQRQQKAEIAQLRPELQRITARVQRRERLKHRIVEQRINQLLEDTPSEPATGPVQIEFLEGHDTFIMRGRKEDVEKVRDMINVPDQGRGNNRTEPARHSAGPPHALQAAAGAGGSVTSAILSRLQSPSGAREHLKSRYEAERAVETADLGIRQAERQLAKTEVQYAEQKKMFESGFVTQADLDDSQSAVDEAAMRIVQARSQLQRARRLLEVVQAEYASGLALLASEMQIAEAEYQVANNELERLRKLAAKNVASRAELDAGTLRLEKARARLEQAKALWELYRKAAQDDSKEDDDEAR